MSKQQGLVITIDGPAGVGKSTVSRKVAARLGFTYLDTGAMYRAVALFLENRCVDYTDERAVEEVLGDFDLVLLPAPDELADVEVVLNGQRLGSSIRTPEMSMLASIVSAQPLVRRVLTGMQRELGRRGRVVAEGRDTGTAVFPNAQFKFYLDARPEVRANRRALQLRAQGKAVDEAELLQMTVARDQQDMTRSISPLKKANDAHVIDTTNRTIDEVLSEILVVVRAG